MDTRVAEPQPRAPDYLPGLSAFSAQRLAYWRRHPLAPRLRDHSGHRLSVEQIHAAGRYEALVAGTAVDWMYARTQPSWLSQQVKAILRDVPAWRGTPADTPFEALQCTSRAQLSSDIVRHIPDHIAPGSLIAYTTSGTTGHPLLIPSQPCVAARYLAYHRQALRRYGIELQSQRGDVAIVLAGMQQRCFTYLSACPTQNEALLAKLNLHPNEWRAPEHRADYLDQLSPEIISGDPISLAALAELPMRHKPRALLSTSMHLLPAHAEALSQRFGCPVLDIYSMNEVGPIAVFDPAAGGHRLLQPWLYVEVLDRQGRALPAGEFGELTFSGGFNHCLPLLRYRSGDYASLHPDPPNPPLLMNLSGRPPVRFRRADGQWLNNLEITHALKHIPLVQYTVRQRVDGSLLLRTPAAGYLEADLRQALSELFGAGMVLEVDCNAHFEDKVIQYQSELHDPISI